MNMSIRVCCTAWSVAVASALASGCASVAPESRPELPSVSAFDYQAHGTAFRVMDLHMLNIGESRQLQHYLQQRISSDVLALSEMLKQYELSTKERTRAQHLLTLIAVQNEKFPVPEWKSDDDVMAALNTALAENPAYADKVRARNWSKPMWQE